MKKSVYPYLMLFLPAFFGCEAPPPLYQEVSITQSADSAKAVAARINENVSVRLADGFTAEIWATDSLAPDPIALSIDEQGNIYITRTNRQKHSEFDIRGHRNWMTQSVSFQTVEDRRNFLKTTFDPAKSAENEWLADLNGDGSHDWRDLTVEKDEVWKMEDRDGDGLAEISTRIVEDFNEEISDVAGALLVRERDMFVGIGPDMWRLEDTDGDGKVDKKTSISHGYAVHIGFGGHGMSGVIEGPDGKIYWGIGDIGANITDINGNTFEYPNEGVIVRCNPDGSDFEVFASGLRNTHEFVFDNYGNLISSDNDGDHVGERERLVHIVEGSDAGWRTNWQYGKYTDPDNNRYNVWMAEGLHLPRWEGQAAYIIPPIVNYHNGPTGMAFNPGTALSSKWKDHFFLVEFVGSAASSHIWAFTLSPKGASFEMGAETDVMSGILPTGMRFGPDGALYFSDWIMGWDTKNYGRVWKLDAKDENSEWERVRKETETLIKSSFSKKDKEELAELMGHADQRIRYKAQKELAERQETKLLETVMNTSQNQLAKVHAIWGLGMSARKSAKMNEKLLPALDSTDPEIVAQALKVLGDNKYNIPAQKLNSLIGHQNDRVKFFAAQAAGRIGAKETIPALFELISKNADKDVYLRHSAVLALSRLGAEKDAHEKVGSSDASQRLASVLILRRLKSKLVADFLTDQDMYIATEAARAIHDDLSIPEAMPALASMLKSEKELPEPFMRRAISAASRLGSEAWGSALVDLSLNEMIDATMRAEALLALSVWKNPSVLDRVDGRFRGSTERDAAGIASQLSAKGEKLILEQDPAIFSAFAKAVSGLGLESFHQALFARLSTDKNAEIRKSALISLGEGKSVLLKDAVTIGSKDSELEVRKTAMAYMDQVGLDAQGLAKTVEPILRKGSTDEKQSLLAFLGRLEPGKADAVFAMLLTQKETGKLDAALSLDLSEAISKSGSAESKEWLARLSPKGDDPLIQFADALNGGNSKDGRNYFYNGTAGQCTRCHAINGKGAQVGPDLAGIGSRLDRKDLLLALVDPSARLAPGYGTVSLVLKDGQNVTGLLLEEDDREIKLQASNAEPLVIEKSRIAERKNAPSGMPPMGLILDKREIRNLVEFLSVELR